MKIRPTGSCATETVAAPRDVPGTTLCRYNDPTTQRAPHNVATGHSSGSAPHPGSSVFEAGRRSPERRGRSPPTHHSNDRAVRATLGRQGRPRRPVLTVTSKTPPMATTTTLPTLEVGWTPTAISETRNRFSSLAKNRRSQDPHSARWDCVSISVIGSFRSSETLVYRSPSGRSTADGWSDREDTSDVD